MHSIPLFSIVTPVFNRDRQIKRAIDSCLLQTFDNFEALVIDDGSTDNTADVILGYRDPRIRFFRNTRNRGVCPARNVGIRAARGEWIVFLDSDDELLPECLRRMSHEVARTDKALGRIGFLYQFDDGRRSPFPIPPPRLLGYEDWLRFIEGARLTDALWATRRSTFEKCMLPESFAPEFGYNLDFSREFRWKIVPDVLGLEHSDSTMRLTFRAGVSDPSKELEHERDRLDHWIAAETVHGGALRQFAPSRYQALLRAKATSNMLVGNRWTGLRASLDCLRRYPRSLINWAVLAGVIAGPGFARRARGWRSRRRARCHYDTVLVQTGSFCTGAMESTLTGIPPCGN